MGIITGYICLFFLLLLLAKYISKRCHLSKINAFLMRVHKYVAGGFLLVGTVHFFLVIRVLLTRDISVVLSGTVIMAAGIALITVCHTMKNRKKELTFHRIFSAVIAIMTILHIIFYFMDYNRYMAAVSDITIEGIDLDTVSDGEYIGECDTGYIYAKVKVVVSDHTIADVELLKHHHERGAAAEPIVKTIVNEQRIDVDAVSGATNSSRVIEKACMNALEK